MTQQDPSGHGASGTVVRHLRSLPIRSRLALLVAAAVAFAVAAVSVSCWFIVRAKLYDEVDGQLRASTQPVDYAQIRDTLANCGEEEPATTPIGPRPEAYAQIIQPDGTTCPFSQSAGTVKVTGPDKTMAEHPDATVGRVRDGRAADGTPVRVLTTALLIDAPSPQPGEHPVLGDAALMIAVPLEGTRSTLNQLALLLLAVSGFGVVGAGAAGLAVARAGLSPVDRLTETVEHVARTEDLAVRIPVAADSEDEIARLSRSFNKMTTSLASSRDLQQQLIADAGHELRTPLTSLRTNIELLTRSEETGRPIPPEDRKALLASVKAQMTELAALIGDLQELSRPDTGVHAGRTRVVALTDVVETALGRARLRGPELTIAADLQPWFVRAEPSALERAVVNILDNAVKFSPGQGTVEVRLADGVLTVRDHGPGIADEELPRVFDRFWRSPSARALPGSGLGLSIVARTVQQAGGEVTLSPAADGKGGTVVTVRLPGASVPPPDQEPHVP